MNQKPGYKTTELWITVLNSVIALLIVYGVLSSDEADAWVVFVAAFVPLALSIATGAYSISRAKVKSSK